MSSYVETYMIFIKIFRKSTLCHVLGIETSNQNIMLENIKEKFSGNEGFFSSLIFCVKKGSILMPFRGHNRLVQLYTTLLKKGL